MAQLIVPAVDLGTKGRVAGGLGACLGFLRRVQDPQGVFAGPGDAIVMVRSGHCSRQLLSFSSPLRIQLFIVPSGVSSRWARTS